MLSHLVDFWSCLILFTWRVSYFKLPRIYTISRFGWNILYSDFSVTHFISNICREVLAATCESILKFTQHHNGGHSLLLDHSPELWAGVTIVLIWTFRTSFSVCWGLKLNTIQQWVEIEWTDNTLSVIKKANTQKSKMNFLATRMKRTHGEYKFVLGQPRHADPAGIDVVVGEAGQLYTVFIKREQIAVSVFGGMLDSSFTQPIFDLNFFYIKKYDKSMNNRYHSVMLFPWSSGSRSNLFKLLIFWW